MESHKNETISKGANDTRKQPLPQVENESKDKDDAADKISNQSRHLPPKSLRVGSADEPLIPFILHWTCVVLTVAASVVFGIWAPLSYQASANGNRDNNAAQSSVINAISAANELASGANDMVVTAVALVSSANSIASRASALQRSQLYMLDGLDYRASAVVMLNYLSFCRGQSTIPGCASLSTNEILSSIESVLWIPPGFESSSTTSFAVSGTFITGMTSSISRVTRTTSTTTPAATSIASDSASLGSDPTAAPSSASSALPVSAQTIFGIVFGVIGVVGMVLGVFVWRYRRNKLRRHALSLS